MPEPSKRQSNRRTVTFLELLFALRPICPWKPHFVLALASSFAHWNPFPCYERQPGLYKQLSNSRQRLIPRARVVTTSSSLRRRFEIGGSCLIRGKTRSEGCCRTRAGPKPVRQYEPAVGAHRELCRRNSR
jgi:hypothetical protein